MPTRKNPATRTQDAAVAEQAVCMPKRLPQDLWISAARTAAAVNPVNHPPIHRLNLIQPGFEPSPMSIAVLTTKYWQSGGVRLTVGFLDNPPTSLRKQILSHMNAWNKTANVSFTESKTSPQVRITRTPRDGHWSYLGTDVLLISPDKPTMNLDSFTLSTPLSEFNRVVRHETGHTMGFPHEHMRRELVLKIDEQKAISFFGETQGWDAEMVRRQVLTPIEESSLLATAKSDPNSIMCYQIPGSITKDGKPIVGGRDIDKTDFEFVGKIYPKAKPAPAKKAPAKKASPAKGSKKAGPKKGGAGKGGPKSGGGSAKKGGGKTTKKSR